MEYCPNSINQFLTLLELKVSNLPKRAQQLCPRLLLIHHDKLELVGGSLDVAHLSPVWRRVVTLVTITNRALIAMATFSSKPNLGIFPGESIKMLVLLPGSGRQTDDGECWSCPSRDPPGIHKNQTQRWIVLHL